MLTDFQPCVKHAWGEENYRLILPTEKPPELSCPGGQWGSLWESMGEECMLPGGGKCQAFLNLFLVSILMFPFTAWTPMSFGFNIIWVLLFPLKWVLALEALLPLLLCAPIHICDVLSADPLPWVNHVAETVMLLFTSHDGIYVPLWIGK